MKEIAKLKKYILESKNLNEPTSYFFNLIDQNILLQAASARRIDDIKSHENLCAAINTAIDIASKSLNKQINIRHHVFTEIPEEQFFHGYCTIAGHPVPLLLLYCADLQVGIAALADLNSRTNFFRFFLTTVKDLKNKH